MTNKIKNRTKINIETQNLQTIKAKKLDEALKANIKRRKAAIENKN